MIHDSENCDNVVIFDSALGGDIVKMFRGAGHLTKEKIGSLDYREGCSKMFNCRLVECSRENAV